MADDIGDQHERQRMAVREVQHCVVLRLGYVPITEQRATVRWRKVPQRKRMKDGAQRGIGRPVRRRWTAAGHHDHTASWKKRQELLAEPRFERRQRVAGVDRQHDRVFLAKAIKGRVGLRESE